jgi:glutaminyl-peptide cyclotransferase
MRKASMALVIVVLVASTAATIWWLGLFRHASSGHFDGERAYEHVLAQLDHGPRTPGSTGSQQTADYISQAVRAQDWQVEYQMFEYRGVSIRNIIARANIGQGPVVIVGAHYDTRRVADQDPHRPLDPVPGANDGASGVAVLLELAQTLNLSKVPYEIWLAFFDAEDQGSLDGWSWIVGSTYMAEHLTVEPEAMILVDMIGDADQQIYLERNSNFELSAVIWAKAAELGYGEYFIPLPRYSMVDDHIPFANRGIPSVLIIDFDYPYWHTVADTADKVSPLSLERVGRTLVAFLESR